ncbi:MAG: DUF1730 domain-containing protein [Muribaculaceae bacterium]|nr:DUF1730 domain-containing protein [Muribaculaceae bacterium]
MLLKKDVENLLLTAGAIKARITPATRVDAMTAGRLMDWIEAGRHAGMDYIKRNLSLYLNPMLLLEGAKSIISMAFNYTPAELRAPELPQIASYAYGLDYHDVIRERLQNPVRELENAYGGEYRICVDSAPVLERMWAERAGVGSRCDNGLITVGDYGTRVFLAEIISTLPADTLADKDAPDEKPRISYGRKIGESVDRELIVGGCTHCGACHKACPTKALSADGTVDARRCLSYLTIEHKGPWEGEGLEAMDTAWGRRTLFGCDLCQLVCPLNDHAPATEIPEFRPIPGIMTMTAAEAAAMSQEEFSRMFKGSPIKRAKLDGLHRNADNII